MGRLIYLPEVVTLRLHEDKCTGCGMCLQVCPHEVLVKDNGRVRISDRDSCMECGACSRNCPAGALEVRAGVGCAQAVINSMLGRSGSGCCCVLEEDGAGASGETSGKGKSGCC